MEPIAEITGIVVHGSGLGRSVGMPTANLLSDGTAALPPEGVYASLVAIGDETFTGVTNIGRRPTVDSRPEITVETNIDAFDRDIYGERITVTILFFLRHTRKMGSLMEVRDQVRKDMERARKLAGEAAAASS